MADAATARLAKLHRVRTLQLDLKRADEARAAERVAQEEQLRDRISRLAQSVAPSASSDRSSAVSFMAAAHYRDRLHASALAAGKRLSSAETGLERARETTRSAKRDQSAIEKLMERDRQDAQRREMRRLEAEPGEVRKKRHDPC